MSFFAFAWPRKRLVHLPTGVTRLTRQRASVQLRLEALEERCTPAVHDLTTAMSFSTIQAAVNAANPGDVILADAGTYTENVTITKALTLEGADHGMNANTRFAAFTGGKANPAVESVLTTPTNNPLGANPNANDLIRVLASGVTIDGFVIDGNNPALGSSLVTGAGGVAIHARRGITNVDANENYIPINNLTAENNIIQNLSQRGVSLDNNSTTVSTGNLITGNVIHDFGSDPNNGGYGVILFNDAYANVTNNTIIDDFGGQTDIQAQHFDKTGSMTFSGNNLTVSQDGIGIEDNFFVPPPAMTSAGVVDIIGNTVNAAAGVTGADDLTYGIYVTDITDSSTATLTNNVIGSSGGQFARGIDLWDLPTTNTVTVSGGTIANSVTGIDLDSVDANFGAGEATTANVNNVTITGGTTGVLVRAATTNQLFPPPTTVDPTAGVALNLSGLHISGATTGVLVQGFSPTITAAATLFQSTITGAGTGVQVAANALLGTGAQPTTQNIIANNATGIALAAGAGAVEPIYDNDLAGNTSLAVNNATGTLVDASVNWFGVNSAAGVAAKVSGNVDYTPYFDAGTNLQPVGTPGFTGDFSVLDVAAGSPQAQATGRIQEGVNDVTAGGTVNVTAGTYAENVTINKNLTLAGAPGDPQTSILQAAGGTGVAIAASATTVTVKGLKITGAANGLTATGLTTLNLADLTLTGNTTSGGSVTNVGTLNYTPDSTTTAGTSVTISATTFQRGTDQAVSFSAVPTFVVNGSPGPDTFDVTPNAATTFTLHGNAPTPQGPPPGDSLTVEQAGTTTPTLTSTFDPTMGYSGSYTFGNRSPVLFDTIEEIQGTADLSVSQPASPSVTEGTTTFSITVTNKGPAAATNVILTDMIPAGTTFVSSSFAGYNPVTGQVNLGTLNSGASVTGTLVVNVPEEGATVTNTASVKSDVTDPNSNDNTSTVQAVATEVAVTGTGGFTVTGFEFSDSGSQTVATFTDPAGPEALTNYSALISWGDGTSSQGVITQANGVFTVSGSHTYTDERGYAITVQITHGTTSTTVSSSASILEELLPNGTRGNANERFLNEVYRDLFNREIDPLGLTNGEAALNGGVSREQLVFNIEHCPSNEYYTDEVERSYQLFLHRAADPVGLNNAVGFLAAGGTIEQLDANILGSQEYFQNRAGGTNDGFAAAMYQDVFGRPIDPLGRRDVDQFLAEGGTRTQAAANILASSEYHSDLANSLYLRFLDRPADTGGFEAVYNALSNGVSDDLVSAFMIGSDEYFNKTVN